MNEVKELKNYIYDNELDLDRIVDDFSPYLKTVINNMVGNNLSYEDKEEILSDTFFILWKNRYNYILSLKAYLAGIARNLVREKLRKKQIVFDLTDYENSVEISNIDTFIEERDEIQRCLSKMKVIEQQIFQLFYYSSESIKDIAKKLNMSEINVTTRLHRIRKKLKKELGIGG